MIRSTITLYEAWWDGRLVGFGLDRVEVTTRFRVRSESRRSEIRVRQVEVGVVVGVIHDWNAEEPDRPSFKLHWTCPECGQIQWEDWSPSNSNPYLGGSLCSCFELWLVEWEMPRS